MEPAIGAKQPTPEQPVREEAPFPISAFAAPSDMDMMGPSGAIRMETEEGSDAAEEEEDGLFAGGDDEEDESDAMEEVSTTEPAATTAMKRKLVEEDDYD